ncbi:unnamed protein product [Withania somnifera]
MVKVLLEAFPQLSVTFDNSNSTTLHTAAAQGHVEVVNFLLETNNSLATIPKNNGKTSLHSSARNGHVAVVKALLSQRVDVVNELIQSNPSLATIINGKGNTALHIATEKAIVHVLVKDKRMKWDANYKSGETALDTAEKEHDILSAKNMKLELPRRSAKELK